MEAHEDYARVERALGFIYENYRQQPSLDEVASEVNLSPYHFQRLFQRWAGVSPKKFLQYLTLQAAKERLRDNDDLLTAAHELGLSGPGRLHDLFINFMGMTPGDYKKGGADLVIGYGHFDSPFGPCVMAATQLGLCALSFFNLETAVASLHKEWPNSDIREDETMTRIYYDALFVDRKGVLPVHMKGTPFRLKVWEALLQIPEGRVISYTQLAQMLGKPKSARAVASAVASNPLGMVIPCHRVIRRMGEMGGYRWGIPRKLALLGWESREAVAAT